MRDVFLVFDGQLPSLPEVAAAIGNIGHVELSPLQVAAALADRFRCWVDLDTGQVYTSDAFVAQARPDPTGGWWPTDLVHGTND